MNESKKIGVTEVVLRDAHQSLLATRFRYHDMEAALKDLDDVCLLYTSPSPRDATLSRMPSSA